MGMGKTSLPALTVLLLLLLFLLVPSIEKTPIYQSTDITVANDEYFILAQPDTFARVVRTDIIHGDTAINCSPLVN